MKMPLMIQLLQAEGYKLFHTGSRAICSKPPEASDDDWVVMYEMGLTDLLERNGYVADPWDSATYDAAEGHTPVASYRKNGVNIVVTTSQKFFDLTKLATDIATELHIKTRDERVNLFHAVRSGEFKTARQWANRGIA